MKEYQLSIYDSLEESQEVATSELLPQVDEAQEPKLRNCKCVGVSPSSALDTITGITEVIEISSEVTDSTLIFEDVTPKFETNQIVTIVDLDKLTYFSGDVENYYYMQDWREKQVRVLSSKAHPRKGFCYEVEDVRTGKSGYFYEEELK